MKARRWLLSISALLVLLLCVVVGRWHWHHQHAEHEAAPVTFAPDRVAAAAPGWVDAAGGLQKLGVRTAGSVLGLHVHEGEKVAAGQVLLQLDDSAVQLQLRAAKVEVERQRMLRAGVITRQARLSHEAAKLELLVVQGAEPATELQQLRASIADLDSELKLAASAIESALIQQQGLNAQVAQHQIKAPARGEVLRVLVHAGDSVAPGTPLLWFAAEGAPVVRAELDERLLPQVRVGMRAEVMPEYAEGVVYAATVQRIARVTGPVQGLPEPRSSATDDRVVEVVLQLQQPVHGQELLIGQRVLVRILAH